MKWTTGPVFRGIVRAALFVSLSWLVLLVLLGDAVGANARDPLVGVLFWTALLAGIFSFVLRSTPVLRRPSTKEWVGAAAIVIHRTPEQVWHFIRDPAYAPVTSQTVERAFRVPGTPDGPGQQQVFVSTEPFGFKQLSLLEVVGETPWIRVDVKNLCGPGWSTYELEPVPAGTQLTVTMASEYARWAAHGMSPKKHLQNYAAEYAQNVKRVIESGAVPANHPSSPSGSASHVSSHEPTQHHPTWPPRADVPPPYNPGNPPIPT